MSTIPFACDYFTGMFAREPLRDSPFAHCTELEATCHHEAAHAVAMYGFGQSLETIQVTARYHDGGTSVSYSGLARPVGPGRVTVRSTYRPWHFRQGVISAAGPAGERRFRQEVEVAMHMLGATEGDHISIDTIAKTLGMGGRDRFAYQRLVWRAALRIVALPGVWAAIRELADALYDEMVAAEDAPEQVASLEPRHAHATCRRHGIRRGAFIPKSPHHVPIFARAA